MAMLYVTTPGATVRVTGDTFRVTRGKSALAEMPALSVEAIVIFGNGQVTTPAIHYCAEHGIQLFFLSGAGRFLAKLATAAATNLPVRLGQMQAAADPHFALRLSRAIVAAKLHNARGYARRLIREGVAGAEHATVADDLSRIIERVAAAHDLNSLRGLEGTGARAYFTVLRAGLEPLVGMGPRSRRPPADPGNALLSLAYSLLTTQVYSAVEIAGLEPYLGFYHADRWGRPALVLDLMEEFRPVIADRLVVGCVRRRIIGADDFVDADEFGVGLCREAFGRFCAQFSTAMNRRLDHPDTGENVTYRRCIELQARRLARVLRGEAEEYEPFTFGG